MNLTRKNFNSEKEYKDYFNLFKKTYDPEGELLTKKIMEMFLGFYTQLTPNDFMKTICKVLKFNVKIEPVYFDCIEDENNKIIEKEEKNYAYNIYGFKMNWKGDCEKLEDIRLLREDVLFTLMKKGIEANVLNYNKMKIDFIKEKIAYQKEKIKESNGLIKKIYLKNIKS